MLVFLIDNFLNFYTTRISFIWGQSTFFTKKVQQNQDIIFLKYLYFAHLLKVRRSRICCHVSWKYSLLFWFFWGVCYLKILYGMRNHFRLNLDAVILLVLNKLIFVGLLVLVANFKDYLHHYQRYLQLGLGPRGCLTGSFQLVLRHLKKTFTSRSSDSIKLFTYRFPRDFVECLIK